MVKTRDEDEARLLESLEQAMQATRNLGLRDMEQILKMAVLELLNHHASQTSRPPACRLQLVRS